MFRRIVEFIQKILGISPPQVSGDVLFTGPPPEKEPFKRNVDVTVRMMKGNKLMFEKQLANLPVQDLDSLSDAIAIDVVEGVDPLLYAYYEYTHLHNSAPARGLNENALKQSHQKALYHELMGELLLDKGDIAQAEFEILKARHLDPKEPGIYNSLGSVYRMRYDPLTARKNFEMAMKLDPTYAAPYANLALLLEDPRVPLSRATVEKPHDSTPLGTHEEVMQLFNKALSLDPKNGTIYLERGVAHMKEGEWLNAQTDFRTDIALNPHDGEAYLRLRDALHQTGNYSEASEMLKKAIERNPKLAEAYHLLADAFWNEGKHDEAIDLLKTGLNQNPTGQLHFQLGEYLGSLREADRKKKSGIRFGIPQSYDVRVQYEASIKDDPTNFWAYEKLAYLIDALWSKEGNPDAHLDAIKLLDNGIQADQNNSDALQNLKGAKEIILAEIQTVPSASTKPPKVKSIRPSTSRPAFRPQNWPLFQPPNTTRMINSFSKPLTLKYELKAAA